MSYQILPDAGATLVLAEGEVTLDDALGAFMAYMSDPQARLPHRFLVDLAPATLSDFTFVETEALIRRLDHGFRAGAQTVRLAFVSSGELQLSMSNLFMAIAKAAPLFEVSAHPDRASAAAALGIDPALLPPYRPSPAAWPRG